MKHICCPVAMHPDGGVRRIPISHMAQSRLSLVSVTLEAAVDTPGEAARALYSQSGLETRAALPIGTSTAIAAGQTWHFALCRVVPPVRTRWQHLWGNMDDVVQFSWLSLDSALPDGLHADDRAAIEWIKAAL
jgi:hypothetical protein